MAHINAAIVRTTCIVAIVAATVVGATVDVSSGRGQRGSGPWVPVSAVVDLGVSTTPPSPDETLRVAAVQMANFNDGRLRSAADEIADKTDKIVEYIAQSAALGADIAVFPEMVLVR